MGYYVDDLRLAVCSDHHVKKRRHLRADAVNFCNEARHLRPDIVFGADIIAGFPTESEAMFDNSLQLIADCGLSFLHIFPFSPRQGTPAARMKQLDRALIKHRAARLRASGKRALKVTLAGEIGKSRAVLVEKPGFGRTEHFIPVAIDTGHPGDIVPARIAASDDKTLTAEAVTSRRVAAT